MATVALPTEQLRRKRVPGGAAMVAVGVPKEQLRTKDELEVVKDMWLQGDGKAVVEDSASRACCKICLDKEDSASRPGCKICVAKAAVLNRIKVTGGLSIETASKEEEEGKAKPAGFVKRASLNQMTAEGGYIIDTEVKLDGKGKPVATVTVRLPDLYVKRLMNLPPRTPLLPLPEDYFRGKDPSHREAMRASAAVILSSIEREEDILAQFFNKGYAIVQLEVEDY